MWFKRPIFEVKFRTCEGTLMYFVQWTPIFQDLSWTHSACFQNFCMYLRYFLDQICFCDDHLHEIATTTTHTKIVLVLTPNELKNGYQWLQI